MNWILVLIFVHPLAIVEGHQSFPREELQGERQWRRLSERHANKPRQWRPKEGSHLHVIGLLLSATDRCPVAILVLLLHVSRRGGADDVRPRPGPGDAGGGQLPVRDGRERAAGLQHGHARLCQSVMLVINMWIPFQFRVLWSVQKGSVQVELRVLSQLTGRYVCLLNLRCN